MTETVSDTIERGPIIESIVSGPTPTMPTNRVESRVERTMKYLQKVQETVQPDELKQFESLMSSFSSKKLEAPELISQVHTLFSAYPELITSFDDFLPHQDRISVSSSVTASARSSKRGKSLVKKRKSKSSLIESGAVERSQLPPRHNPDNQPNITEMPSNPSETSVGEHFSNAVVFVNTVKQTFVDTPEVYFEFLNILRAYQRDNRSPLQIYERVSLLFEGHPELLEGFKQFVKLDSLQSNPLTKSESNETLDGMAAAGASFQAEQEADERQPLLGSTSQNALDLESSRGRQSRSAYTTAVVFAVLGWVLFVIAVLAFVFRSSLPVLKDM